MLKRNFILNRAEDKTALTGYAFKFSEIAIYLGQKERFSPDLKLELNPSGCYFLRDHNPERVLAKHPDTFDAYTDNQGLVFKAKFLNTPLWLETRELVAKGVLNGVSVGFQSIQEEMEGDTLVYKSIKLYECSVVTWPSYSSSEVKARHNKTLKNIVLPPACYL